MHTLLAAFGLSIIIAKSIFVFNIIKFAGAAYLLYMGYKMLTDKSQLNSGRVSESKFVDFWKIYRGGILTNVLNPKVALFFIAFLPQFIDTTVSTSVWPFLILGTTFIITGTTWCCILAIFAATIFSKLKDNQKASTYINRVCGLSLIGLGVKVALSTRK